ncbi:DUF6151 family protein [Paraglaciecola sp.]|uniref:DUF6151 family protein n=1 Tax=Paraglaciecola sp. TaxID=1920173 RepID=UPI003EF77F03
MSHTVNLKCYCGSLKGTLEVVPKSFFHVHCLCCDCQKFAAHLGNQERILDEHGGSELFQTYPAYFKISEGAEHLRCATLTPKGIYRWHTACCNMPVANTMTSAAMPFVGVSVKLMQFSDETEKQKVLGPVTLKAFGKYAIQGTPADTHPTFPRTFLPKIIWFMLKGFLGKKSKPSSLFKGNAPITKPYLLPKTD